MMVTRMDDKTRNRILGMLEMDVNAFLNSTNYSRQEILEAMEQSIHAMKLKEKFTKKKPKK